MPWTVVRHASADALADALAALIAEAIDRALRLPGEATLALAGGRTPLPAYRRLAAQRRDGSGVTIVPSDERWVRTNHADHNLGQLQAAFAAAAGVCWLPLVPPEPGRMPDARFAERALAGVRGNFALAVLGMGDDGHVASLFPGAPTLPAALDPSQRRAAMEIVPDPMPAAAAHPRVTLTLPRLLRSDRLLLVINGADKLAVVERARSAAAAVLPVAALLAAPHGDAQIHWSP